MDQSKTFCILPWIHIYANPDGSVLPCCIGDHNLHMGNTRFNTIEEIFNNDKFKTMRSNMLEGKRCNECKACYRDEDSGNTSFRQTVNKQFEKYIPDALSTQSDGTLDEMKLRYLDVRWSNICNFKCRSCSSTYSSSWATEDGKDKIYILAGGDSNDGLYQQFEPHFDTVEEFYFAGGEPLLTDKHYDILEYLIDHGRTDVRLRYNTNLSVLKYKNKNILDMWKQFKDVNVYVSLDSWGERAEYIREGTEWNTIEHNIKQVKDLGYINLQSSTVISIYNVLTMTDFLDYLFDNDIFNLHNFYPSFYNIMNPEHMAVSLLDKQSRIDVIQKFTSARYNDHIDKELFKIVNHIRYNADYRDDLVDKFISENERYDSKRNRDWKLTFPELFERFYQ